MKILIDGVEKTATPDEKKEIEAAQLLSQNQQREIDVQKATQIAARTSALAKLAKLGLTQAEIEAL